MSGIGDGDNSDLQRIREVNQAELRRRVDQQKRGHQARVDRSFKEVMAERGRERVTQNTQRQAAPATTTPRHPEGQRLLDQVRSQAQRTQGDLANKAAMSRSAVGSLASGRTKGHRSDALAAEGRAEQLTAGTAEELDHIRETAREDDVRDVRSVEDKQAEVNAEAQGDGDPIHRDGQRRQHHQRDGAGGDDSGPAPGGVEAAEGPRAPHVVTVPPALIKQLVAAVYKAVGPDGRTQMQIHLRGGPLDGVKLEVKANDGRVECTFHGCNREMDGLLRAGRGALEQSLGKKGLKLAALTVA